MLSPFGSTSRFLRWEHCRMKDAGVERDLHAQQFERKCTSTSYWDYREWHKLVKKVGKYKFVNQILVCS